MFFDAFGRFSFGQISQPAATTAILVAAPGSYAIGGTPMAFRAAFAATAGSYGLAGFAATFKGMTPATAGSYAITGVSAPFGAQQAAAAGSYNVAGQAATFKGLQVAPGGSYGIAGNAADLRGSLLAVTGAFAVTGYATTDAFVVRADAGSYALTPGLNPLTRTGADFDLVYGGVGHTLEEIERLRQLARITRKTPAPIVQPSAPLPQHLHAIAAQPPRIDPPAVAAQHLAMQRAPSEQAAISKRRRQALEILLLAS